MNIDVSLLSEPGDLKKYYHISLILIESPTVRQIVSHDSEENMFSRWQ
jgi:hypothetical protein